MKKFNYHSPQTINDCYSLFKELEAPFYLAGGMTLLPSMKQGLSSPTDLIDLTLIKEMKGIFEDQFSITVGSLTTHNEIAKSKLINENILGLSSLASKIADNAIRNKGTLGGSVCNADPAADYPAALISLDSVINTNLRKIKAKDFFLDMFETSLQEGEILVSITFSKTDFSIYEKFASQASKYAIIGIFAALKNLHVKISVTGASNKSFLIDELDGIHINTLKEYDLEKIDFTKYAINSDINASSEYRISLIKSLTKKCLTKIIYE